MAECRYCHNEFEDDGKRRNGVPMTGCPSCRERRAKRKHMVVYGYAVAHDEGNGRRPPPTCPVCGEVRAVMTLCLCERLLETGAMRPEDLDRDYARRYGGEVFPSPTYPNPYPK